jgi:long-chain acyl-CoA synthetase
MEQQSKAITRPEAVAALTAPGQYYELVEIEVHGHPCRVFKNAPETLREFFYTHRSDNEFYVYDDERYTFEDIYQLSCQVAHMLERDYGIARGDRVAISMRNYPEWVIAFQAITSIGAIAVCMNALWKTEEMEYGLEHAGVRVLIADQERIDRVTPIYHKLALKVLAVRPDKPLPRDIPLLHDAITAHQNVAMPRMIVHADDDATILYTSGSTGHPKGAVSSHRNIINALYSWELDGAVAGYVMRGGKPAPANPPQPAHPPATLLGVPLFHVAGSHAVMLNSYRAQRKTVAMYKWDSEIAAELIERERISSFNAPAAMTGDLVEIAKKTNRDLSSLASVGGGGAPRAPEQVRSIAKSFKNAQPGTGWGMTETNAIGTGIGGQDYLNKPLSSGRPSAILDFAIVDDEGNHLPANERGELLIRGTSIIRGYWNRPDANAETFVDRWLRTGDVAYLDEDGFLFIVDRIKDLVIRGGENVGCGEVEAALLTHGDIQEASVYGIPDKRLGEEIGATVYCRQAVDEESLRGHLLDHLAHFKIPKYIRFHDEPLPRIASGKIAKRQLREEHRAALGIT